ncbi:hypothetical protein [Pseudonocardia nigra]|uniref:hypothetical protein n=1 Tax=Pseudonocardia nigra TaxID=1921578 RepID=UPI001C5E688B|nr:hypothetical protein [Pseudonocardia nigra]
MLQLCAQNPTGVVLGAERAHSLAELLGGTSTLVVEDDSAGPTSVAPPVRRLADAGVTVGIGTITDLGDVHRAADAGARFVVSFRCPPGFVAAARERDLLPVPGALTPSEVHASHAEGAGLIKLFLAGMITPGYLSELAPLVPGAEYVISGGIRLNPEVLAAWRGADEVRRRAARAVELVSEVAGS